MRERKKDCMQTVINHLHDRDILCLKDFNAKSIGRLISMKGIVVKASEIYP
jgi:DNA replicative helicase MCM subunit Mcm2 (Cdc46/Mcm family)